MTDPNPTGQRAPWWVADSPHEPYGIKVYCVSPAVAGLIQQAEQASLPEMREGKSSRKALLHRSTLLLLRVLHR